MDKKGEVIDITNADETARMLRDLKHNDHVNTHLAGMTIPEQEAYLYETAKEAREFFEDPEMSE